MGTRVSDKAIIQALKLSAGKVSLAAKKIGCHFDTIYDHAKSNPEIRRVMAQEREELLDLSECQLKAAVLRGEAWAICFSLKCQGKDRGWVERAEITGANGGPLQLQAVKNAEEMTDDELAAIAAGAGERTKPGRGRKGIVETPGGETEPAGLHELSAPAVCDELASQVIGEEAGPSSQG